MERRNTIQKQLVLDAVFGEKRHVTADEVYEVIRVKHEHIGKGTIYRNLGILAEEGKIKKIETTDGPDFYDFNLTDHFHARCVYCNSMFDVALDVDEMPDLCSKASTTKGIRITSYDISFKGICSECQRREEN